MLEFWDRYELLVLLVLSVNVLFLFFYSFLARNRKPWFECYWKAGVLWFICPGTIMVERLIPLPGVMIIMVKAVSFFAFLSGIYFTVRGAMLERRYRRLKDSAGS